MRAKRDDNLRLWESTAHRDDVYLLNAKQPDDVMVGFIPFLPAYRELIPSITGKRDRLSYTNQYAANYYAMRDAIARDQYDRRGGYRKAYKEPLSLYVLYLIDKNATPLHTKYQSKFDLDNCDKTFIDALSTTTYHTISNKRYRHIQDDSLFVRHASEKRSTQSGEMCGIWFALRKTDFSKSAPEEYAELKWLISADQFRSESRKSFNLWNLNIARDDGKAFLEIANELDSKPRVPMRTRIAKLLTRLAKLIDPEKDSRSGGKK